MREWLAVVSDPAIAIIDAIGLSVSVARTSLNYFLERDLEQRQRACAAAQPHQPP